MSAASGKQVSQESVARVRALLARAEQKLSAGEFLGSDTSHVSGGSWVRDNGWERQRNACKLWLRDHGLEGDAA